MGVQPPPGAAFPCVDIAVNPLEGTNLCATGAPSAIAGLAASEPGGLLNAPDCYMEKIIAGPGVPGCVDIDAPVDQNLRSIARRLDREIADLTVIVLDRPCHHKLVEDIREAGARIRLIGDGDLSAGIRRGGSGQRRPCGDGNRRGAGRGDHGGGPALPAWRNGGAAGGRHARAGRTRRADGNPRSEAGVHVRRSRAPGDPIVFAACGATDGVLLRGVRLY